MFPPCTLRFFLDFSMESARWTKEVNKEKMALASVLGSNQNVLVKATPVFVLDLPAVVVAMESVVAANAGLNGLKS